MRLRLCVRHNLVTRSTRCFDVILCGRVSTGLIVVRTKALKCSHSNVADSYCLTKATVVLREEINEHVSKHFPSTFC